MPPTTVHDYYAILEIPQDAKPAAIRLAYKRLARKKHPDKRINQPNATAEFQLVSLNTACSLLPLLSLTNAAMIRSKKHTMSSWMTKNAENTM
jgi:preprotein translocase subunit Sec63